MDLGVKTKIVLISVGLSCLTVFLVAGYIGYNSGLVNELLHKNQPSTVPGISAFSQATIPLKGERGSKGDSGLQGLAGPQGPSGVQGLQGVAGQPGAPGPIGQTGAAGATGAPGTSGGAGATGPVGPSGTTGATGATGATGPTGAIGAVGPQGPAGSSGTAACPNGTCVSLQAAAPGVQETGNVSLTGAVTADRLVSNRVYQRPYKLLIYYGTPQGVNGKYENNYAAQTFSRWDYVVFGAGLEDPGNVYNSSTQTIISKMHSLNAQVKVFGYIDVGVTTGNYSISQLQTFVNQWKTIGADSIFMDVAGYDFHVSRSRLNTILDYIHGQGMNAIVNAFTPADVMGSNVDATYNPTGTPTHMNASDFYLLESWVVNTSSYTTHNGFAITSDIKTRGDSATSYRSSLGVKILSVGVVDYSSYTDEQITRYFKMNEAASMAFSLDGYGIGATNYSSIAPNVNVAKNFEYNPTYPQFYNTTAPYTINNAWTEITRPDIDLTFHNDFSTSTFWYSTPQTNILKLITLDTTKDNLGIGTASPQSRLHVQGSDAATVATIIQGASGQTADLFQIQNSSGTNLVKVGSSGAVTFSGPTLALNGNMRGISSAVGSGATTLVVTFTTAQTDTNYAVLCTPNFSSTCYVTSQTTSGFTLNFGTAAPASATVHWLVIR